MFEYNKKIDYLIYLIYFVFSSFSLRNIFILDGALSGNDWGIPPLNEQLVNAFEIFQYSWFHISNLTGFEVLQANKLYLNLYSFTYVLSVIGFDGAFITKLLVLLPIALSGIFAYTLLRYLKCEVLAAFIGGIIYMFSPFVFNLSVLGGILELYTYSFIPLTFVLFLKSISEKSWFKYSFLIAIMFSFYIKIAIVCFILFASYSLFLIFKSSFDKKIFSKIFRSFFIPGVLFILLQAYWTLSLLSQSSIASMIGGIPFQLGGHTEINLIDFFRGLGFWASYYEQTVLFNNYFLIAISILVPLCAFFCLLVIKNDLVVEFFSYFSLFIIFITVFNILAYLVINNILIFGILRDFTYTYTLYAVSYVVLIGKSLTYFLSLLSEKIDPSKKYDKKCLKIILILILGVFISIYCSPFILGGDFSGNLKVLNLSKDYNQVNNWVKSQNLTDKVLWLPTGSSYVSEKNSELGWHSDYYAIFSDVPGGFIDSNYRYFFIPEYWVEDLLYENNVRDLGKLMGLFNIKYVILRVNEEVTQWATVLGNVYERRTSEIENTLENQIDLKQIYNLNNVSIYENSQNLPLVYATTSSILVTGELNVLQEFAISNFDFSNTSVIFACQQSNPEVINYSENIFISNESYLDLLIPLNIESFLYEPGEYVKSQDIVNDWSSLHHLYWWYNSNYQTALENSAFTVGNDVTLSIPIEINEDGNYSMFIKLFDGQKSNQIMINFNHRDSTIRVEKRLNGRYVWKKVDKYFLRNGTYDLDITSYGENVIANIMIIPDTTFVKNLEYLNESLKSKYIIYDNNSNLSYEFNYNNLRDLDNPSKVFCVNNLFEKELMVDSNVYFLNESINSINIRSINNYSRPFVIVDRINPTKYDININASQPFILVFSESYNSQWKGYAREKSAEMDKVIANSLVKVQEKKQEMQFTPQDLSYLFAEPLPEDTHFLVNGYANAWYIDPAELPKDSEGNINITLYFWPQSLFYLGLIISGTTLIICLGYLVYDWRRRKSGNKTI